MSKEDDAPQERERVFARIAPLVMDYASSHAGEAFRAEELRQFVLERDPLIAPDSPGRILRELRLAGKIDYVVINRRQSLYQFRHLPWQLELL
jgi:hypothetical protein